MKVDKDETRKGPWTEQEDLQLVWFVRLLGERRWDFLAKVSGLNRTGKSCRLRWVNYLNPGLKRGRMTPDEEHLVLELHAKWGNRWSRIARRLPGRTDNEIKNYWRTHMRKKAQERKRNSSLSPTSSSFSSSPSSSSNVSSSVNELAPSDQLCGEGDKHEADSGSGAEDVIISSAAELQEVSEEGLKGYMDQLWNEIYAPSAIEHLSFDEFKDASANVSCAPPMLSPVWEDSLWRIDDEDFKISTQ